MATRERRIDEVELHTVFQPMRELETKSCIAYEALTRFPEDTARETSEWFAEANDRGVGEELELRAIRSALSFLNDFPEGAVLAINVSPAVAVTDAFFEVVAPVAESLIIEITEHEPVDDYATLETALSDLRALGARIAIDDVGSGFASLRHILRLAPDILKLDLSLTHGVGTNPACRALTAALVDFADETGALITAEGIETEEELELLRELGIDHGQGYLLGRPGPLTTRLH
jgi:EAL domain-containing protein (putative c-di-GMP-specific phosphodiesterase class I)